MKKRYGDEKIIRIRAPGLESHRALSFLLLAFAGGVIKTMNVIDFAVTGCGNVS